MIYDNFSRDFCFLHSINLLIDHYLDLIRLARFTSKLLLTFFLFISLIFKIIFDFFMNINFFIHHQHFTNYFRTKFDLF